MNQAKLIGVSCMLALLAETQGTLAQELTSQPMLETEALRSTQQSCSDCHDGDADTRGPGPGPPHRALAESVHRDLDCAACHESIHLEDVDPDSPKPHGESVAPVDCGECHEEEEAYVKHGRMQVGRDPDIPMCWSCHGAHDILPSSDRQSHVHLVNLASTCRSCHTGVDLVKKHQVLRDAPIKLYESSVHGKTTPKGIYAVAICTDCHSPKSPDGTRTAHRILSPADPESPIFHFSIPDTCGQCHESVTRDYWEGVHGQFVKRGSLDAPVCSHCHGEHGIISPDDARSPVSAARLAEQTCTPCHESVVLNEKYGLRGGRVAFYIDTYHGLKSKAGDVAVANCASCHGAHRILPSTDASSPIHPSNLRATCGECHPGISAELAQTKIHGTETDRYTGWPEFFRNLYIVLIVVTIGLMLLHNGADWLRFVTRMSETQHVQRLGTNEVIQHWVLMLSFIVLVVSGFSLRFSDAWWVRLLFGREGGFELRGIVHRAAAVVLIIWTVWHMLYLFTPRGRHWLRDMLGRKSDLRDVWHNTLYFLGRRHEEPRFGRFTYMEKIEYWALIWGTLIMTVTGLFLWFDTQASRLVPRVVLDVMLVIHYYEAWLATLAILVWHIYGTVFRPSVYPMNPAWLAGRMPKNMYVHEHPEGPKLKARVYRSYYEEEAEEEEQDAGQAIPAKGSNPP